MRQDAIFSWWQNAMMAAFGVVMAPVGAVMIGGLPPPGAAAHVTVAVWCGLCLLAAVRGAMQGVYGGQAALIVRGPLHTRRIPWPDVIAVEVYQSVGNGGRPYFAPLVEYRPAVGARPKQLPYDLGARDGRTATVRVYWLAATTEQGARRFADRMSAMADRAR